MRLKTAVNHAIRFIEKGELEKAAAAIMFGLNSKGLKIGKQSILEKALEQVKSGNPEHAKALLYILL